jgi:hypothetical protein
MFVSLIARHGSPLLKKDGELAEIDDEVRRVVAMAKIIGFQPNLGKPRV